MIKVYFSHGPNPRETREHLLIKQGLANNSRVEVVQSEKESDVVFQFYYRMKDRFPVIEKYRGRKTIIIDYHDNPHWTFKGRYKAYFKRSWVGMVRDANGFAVRRKISWPSNFYPLTFAIMDEFVIKEEMERDIAVTCTLRDEERNYNRLRVLKLLKDMTILDKSQIGRYNRGAMDGFNDEHMRDYFRLMKRSRIVVTGNPDKWEGDHRTWEAFASGALVFVDKTMTPLAHPLIDGKHCIFYKPSERGLTIELREKIFFYLEHYELARDIAKTGYDFTMKYHMVSNRIDEILDVIT